MMNEIKSVTDIVCKNDTGIIYKNPITQREHEILMDLKWNDSLTREQSWELQLELKQIKQLPEYCRLSDLYR